MEEYSQPNISAAARHERLEFLHQRIIDCRACQLYGQRQLAVPGEGAPDPLVLFIAEAPGASEDACGLPFQGPAGNLFDKMLAAMQLTRHQVFVTNVVCCHPPHNRVPTKDEIAACRPWLVEHIEILQPKVIVTLGKTASEGLLNCSIAITRERGKWREFNGIPLLPTYHPSYLLRPPEDAQRERKRQAWHDLQAVMHRMGEIQ